MTRKISLNIQVPGIGVKHEFLIPEGMNIQKVIELMSKTLCEEYNGMQADLHNLMLVDYEKNIILNPKYNFKQLGINNGSKLILM